MDNELGRLANAPPGLMWAAPPDGHIDFPAQRWCECTALTFSSLWLTSFLFSIGALLFSG